MPTPIINPPVGVKQSEKATVAVVQADDLVPILRPATGKPGQFENVNVKGSSIAASVLTANQLTQDEVEAVQHSAGPTASNPFVTITALQTALATRDPYAVGSSATVPLAVLDLSNTWLKGDLTAYGSAALQQAGAPPAVAGQHASILVGTADVQTRDEFDYGGYRFVYGRRNDGTSGWTRLQKA